MADVHGLSLPFRWIGRLFLLMALGSLGLAGWLYAEKRSETEQLTRAVGTVIDIEAKPREPGESTQFVPVVEFVAADGETYEIVPTWSSSPPAYDLGESVTVVYDPRVPRTGELYVPAFRYLAPIVLGLMGLCLTVAGITLTFVVPATIRRTWPKTES